MSSDMAAFLSAFCDEVPNGLHMLLWTLPDRISHWCTTVAEVKSTATKLANKGHDVYVGVGFAPRNFGKMKRCPANQIAGIAGLWVDVDYQSTIHTKKNLPPDEQTAMDLIESMGLSPTLVVHSGNGLQAYWLFNELWIFDSDEEREEAASMSRRWNATLRARARMHGWDVDSTFDLSRILRLPGTYNHKSDPPKPVRLLGLYDDRRYNIHEFEKYLLDDEHTAHVATTSPVSVGALILDPNANPPLDKLIPLLENDPRVRRTWHRARTDMQDQSPSAYDLSLASFAVRAHWTDQEIANLLIAHRRHHGDDLKLRQDYYQRTIRTARASFEREQREQELKRRELEREEQVDKTLTELQKTVESASATGAQTEDHQPETDEETRQKILKAVSSMLTVEITRFVKYLSDPPVYRLETRDGAVLLGNASALTSQSKFKTAVYSATGRAIPKFKSAQWDQIIEALAKAAVEEGLGEEATDRGTARSWLLGYIRERRPLDNIEDAVEAQHPFQHEGHIYIFGANLRNWLNVARGERVSAHQMGAILRAHGCEPQTIGVVVDGKKTTRSVWRIHPAVFD